MKAGRIIEHANPGQLLKQLLTPNNRNRLQKLILAVVDQMIFSGSNFLFSVLLGRWMDYDNYGAFTYAYSLFLLIASFHNALLLEPFTIFGSSQHRFSLRTYAQRFSRLQVYWTLGVSGICLPFGLVVWLSGNHILSGALFGLALSQGAILAYWYVRRKWYVARRLNQAVIGSAVYAVAQIAAVFGLRQVGILTPFSALAAIGVAGLIAAGVGQISSLQDDSASDPIPLGLVVKENWQYGKWLMFAGVLSWLTLHGYNVLTGSLLNLADTGGLKALQNPINPIIQLFTAFSLVFTPAIARRHAELGERVTYRDLLLYGIFVTSCAVVYWLVLVIFQEPIFDLLYNGQYSEYVYLLPYLGLLPIIIALSGSWGIGLRILRQTPLLFWVDSLGAVFTIIFGTSLVYQYGLVGAVAGMVISNAVRVPMLAYLWRRATRSRIPEPQTPA